MLVVKWNVRSQFLLVPKSIVQASGEVMIESVGGTIDTKVNLFSYQPPIWVIIHILQSDVNVHMYADKRNCNPHSKSSNVSTYLIRIHYLAMT